MKSGIVGLMSVTLVAVAHAATSPIPMLETTATQITTTLKQHQSELKTHPKLIHQAIEHYLLPHVDVNGMSRSVLGRTLWQQATPVEKREFIQVFTQLVIRTYASPLSDYAGETVTFTPLRAPTDTRFIRVNSTISRLNGQKIPLSYHLVYQQGEWKIYDLSVEGVSLLQSFRSQFGQMMQHATMHDLIEKMRHQA